MKLFRALLLVAVVMGVTGCAGFPSVDSAFARAAGVSESLTDRALHWLCGPISVREWRERFKTPVEVDAWRTICAPPISTPEEDRSK